jgi:hypothetical protein
MYFIKFIIALIKKKIKFSSYVRKFEWSSCKVIYDYNGLLIYGEIFAHFLIYYEALPHI